MPGVVFHAVDADLTESKATAGADGTAIWTPPAPGSYSIYTRDATKRSGEAGRQVRTRKSASSARSPSPGRSAFVEADPEAVTLFEQALDARAQWKDFPRFLGPSGRRIRWPPYSGSVRFLADGKVED